MGVYDDLIFAVPEYCTADQSPGSVAAPSRARLTAKHSFVIIHTEPHLQSIYSRFSTIAFILGMSMAGTTLPFKPVMSLAMKMAL